MFLFIYVYMYDDCITVDMDIFVYECMYQRMPVCMMNAPDVVRFVTDAPTWEYYRT